MDEEANEQQKSVKELRRVFELQQQQQSKPKVSQPQQSTSQKDMERMETSGKASASTQQTKAVKAPAKKGWTFDKFLRFIGVKEEDPEEIINGIVPNELRMVIIGKSGTGKSSTANTILGKKKFKSLPSGTGVTIKSEMGQAKRFGKKILLVDTPGLFDPEVTNEMLKEEIGKCIAMTAPGFHAFLLVIQIGRFTPEEQTTVKEFANIFGEKLFDYTIIVFTRFDDLQVAGITLEDYLETKIPDELKTIVKKIKNRCIGFNNRASKHETDTAVKELLHMIEKMDNDGKFYTNELYEEAEEYICKQIGNKIKDETDKKVKELKSFYEKQIQKEIEKIRQEYERKQKEPQQRKEELEKMRMEFERVKVKQEQQREKERALQQQKEANEEREKMKRAKQEKEEEILKAQTEAREMKRKLEIERQEKEDALQRQKEAEKMRIEFEKEKVELEQQREKERALQQQKEANEEREKMKRAKQEKEEEIRKAQADMEEMKRKLEKERQEKEDAIQKQKEAERHKEMLKWEKEREIEIREEERKKAESTGIFDTVVSYATSSVVGGFSAIKNWWYG